MKIRIQGKLRKMDEKLLHIFNNLGISVEEIISTRKIPLFSEATNLVLADIHNGREFFLTKEAALNWSNMKEYAFKEDVDIFLVSAFRSIERQYEIILTKINKGQSINDILLSLAPPGFSEHHTGNAIDIGTYCIESLQEEFESTEAFSWLKENAHLFNFHMSYPKNNPHGFIYEPWHWCYHTK